MHTDEYFAEICQDFDFYVQNSGHNVASILHGANLSHAKPSM